MLKAINQPHFYSTYNRWLGVIEQREYEIIKNIYKHLESNKYRRALFLIGAEHIELLIERIKIFETHNNQKRSWNFNYFDSLQTSKEKE